MPPGSAIPLQPRRHVHPIAEDVAAIDDNVSDIYAYPELNSPVRRDSLVADDHLALDFHGAAHSVDDARKLHEHAVASGLDDLSVMRSYSWIDERLAMTFEGAQRALFV